MSAITDAALRYTTTATAHEDCTHCILAAHSAAIIAHQTGRATARATSSRADDAAPHWGEVAAR